MVSPGRTAFIITIPSATAIDMLAKNSTKVRTASGPSRERSPSCTTPEASEPNTSGITTKNNMRRNTCPSGSSTLTDSARAAFNNSGKAPPSSSVAAPSTAPATSPNKIRLASFGEVGSDTAYSDFASGLLRKPYAK